jgi:aspartate/methionine/tyrosine aminotransferase
MTNPFLARVAAPPIGQAALWAKSYDGRNGPLIDLSQAVPGNPPPPDMLAKLAEASGSPDCARYGPILGDVALREIYAAHVSEVYGAPLTSGETAITAGCNQAFFVALISIAAAGDAVILPTPSYFNHTMALDMLGIETRALATRAEDGFLPDPAALEALIDGKVKAVALVTPNNPTGAIYPPALIAEVFAICVKHGIRLILDETYRDFLPATATPPHALFAEPGWRDTLVSLYSFSKSYAIPGHRMGAIAAADGFLAEAAKVMDTVQICPPRPPQPALAWAIGATAAWRREKTAEIIERAEIFRATLQGHPDWRIEQIGAYFAYVRHPYAGHPSAVVAEGLAREFGIVTLPGSFFGAGQDGHLRIAFANISAERIASLGERLHLARNLFAPLDTVEA